MRKALRFSRYYGLMLSRKLWETRGIWLRAFLCLFLGLGFLVLEDSRSFDQRFQLRGRQPTTSEIAIVSIAINEWSQFVGADSTGLRALKEFSAIGDQFFWSPRHLDTLLEILQKEQPEAIGVTFFFQKSKGREPLPNSLKASNLIWASRLNLEGQPILPALAKPYGGNTGVVDLPVDNDKAVRRFSQPFVSVPHMAIRLARFSDTWSVYKDSLYPMPGVSKEINYRGSSGTFTTYSLREILDGKANGKLAGKIVLVGASDLESHLVYSPLGTMTKAEVLANILDNFISHRWFLPSNGLVNAGYMLLILALSILILFSYPQSVAFVFLVWLGLGMSAFSLWIFDTYYFWLPLLSPVAMMAFTYILFMGYQLTQKENINWRLKQEQKYNFEVEQLKHNFVSLISHDLKTPIAKIQAICDRLMAKQDLDQDVQKGLTSLRKENSELNRYIQSILKVSRVESRDFRISKEAADINEIIFKVLEQLRPLASAKSQELISQLEPMFSIEIDSVLIGEVILNLIENSIKYTPEKGKIIVSSQEIDNEVIFAVRDDGLGISAQDQKKIFSKFYRVKASEQREKGSGIGLYLVKYFIELHGGRVFVESELGAGAKIGFTLPIMDESIQPVQEQEGAI